MVILRFLSTFSQALWIALAISIDDILKKKKKLKKKRVWKEKKKKGLDEDVLWLLTG